MKKIPAVLLLLMLLVGFTACGAADTESAVVISTASDADNGPAGLKTALDDIATLQPGTMGVSMVATAKAVDLLEWCANTDMTAAQVGEEVAAYLSVLPQESKVLYPQQLLLVTSAAANMQDAEYRTYMLLDIGYDPEGFAWDEETFAKVAAITEKAHGFVVPTE